jgi:integrase
LDHLARRTFACTVGLANGLNTGVLSKLLGHSSIQITLDSYATVIDELMISNVRALKEMLSNQDSADNKNNNQDEN